MYFELRYCTNLRNLEVSATNLISFKYFGPIMENPFKNVPLLSEVSIGGDYVEELVRRKFHDLSGVLSQIKRLVLELEYMVFYSSHYIPKTFPEFRNLKQLELDVAAVPDQNILFLAPLIDVSPCLYRLVVKVKFWSPSKGRRRQEPLEWECRCPGEPRENINGLLESLKVVEIVGWVGHTTDIQLAMYLLEKAVLLETIIIDPRSPYAKGRYEFEELAEKGKKDAARERAKQLEAKLPSGTKLTKVPALQQVSNYGGLRIHYCSLRRVRCSDSTIEGEEESAEEKRQKALVALIVTSPFGSLDTLNKLLYSPNVDVSQQIMIVDIMTDAAQELADSRLESPAHLVRRMASCIALVLSKIINPENPLYLDDSCCGETIDWEFGLATSEKGMLTTSECSDKGINKVKTSTTSLLEKEFNNIADNGVGNNDKTRKKSLSEFKLVDPDEIIDPATLNNELVSGEEEDDDASENSETLRDSSSQPYDLSDDDTDLKRKFSQLVDVIGALRKSDDADGAERALDVAEKLVRASPDELRYVTGDLVRTLVQVRCSDSTIEGEEESAEEKRQKALVALIVTSPFESLDTLNKLLYSPNLDVSQRIMILDIMTDAAQELADSKIMKPKHQPRNLISTISETQPWFMPSSIRPSGAGPWKEILATETPLNWSYSYERELPPRSSKIQKGKTR
ncbi:Telomere length regulation protein [Actinidia chinensis var. chinensis]|uniref:Telomere length regulation protein n=1 Tax=Actinidia chinensis var. chinensis TaxID=1590841 RepID=A0A2R6QGF1_ACTCC|nr:Telomere length regulation protein [Actinidia chinensis var. chinensis]